MAFHGESNFQPAIPRRPGSRGGQISWNLRASDWCFPRTCRGAGTRNHQVARRRPRWATRLPLPTDEAFPFLHLLPSSGRHDLFPQCGPRTSAPGFLEGLDGCHAQAQRLTVTSGRCKVKQTRRVPSCSLTPSRPRGGNRKLERTGGTPVPLPATPDLNCPAQFPMLCARYELQDRKTRRLALALAHSRH